MADCPACGEPFAKEAKVESGDSHRDTFPAPPYSMFKQYIRICADPDDIGHAVGSSHQPVTVYLHTWRDVAQGGDPSLRT